MRTYTYMPSRVRTMQIEEAAWVGAMIEGEGGGYPKSKQRRTIGAQIVVYNSDPEIISAMLRATGTGSVYRHVTPSKLTTKPTFVWCVNRWLEIQDLVRQCARYSMKLQRLAERLSLAV